MTHKLKKMIFLIAGLLCLCLGFLGILLPLLPTTVFLILAAFFFAKSSPRLRAWLLNHESLGPPIRNWEASGAIAPKHKRLATVMMTLTFAISVALALPAHVLVIQAICLVGAGLYVNTRPNA